MKDVDEVSLDPASCILMRTVRWSGMKMERHEKVVLRARVT